MIGYTNSPVEGFIQVGEFKVSNIGFPLLKSLSPEDRPRITLSKFFEGFMEMHTEGRVKFLQESRRKQKDAQQDGTGSRIASF